MKKGFTLFETLLALFIVGIISALFIPGVMTSFNNKGYVASLQKVSLGVEEAIKRMIYEEGVSSVSKSTLYKTGSASVKATAGEFLTKYFSLAKDCGTSKSSCFANKYINLNKENITKNIAKGDFYCGILDTGAAICVSPMTSDGAEVFVDVNAEGKPNIAGRDLFLFHITKDGIVKDLTSGSDCRNSENAGGCFKKLKNNDWEMNY